MLRRQTWSPPILQDKLIRLSGGSGWQGVCEAPGSWSNYDFWIQAPNAWLDAEFRFSVDAMDQVVVLEQKFLRDMALMTIRSGSPAQETGIRATGPGAISGILFSIRGRPGSRCTVEARRGGVLEDGAGGTAKCYLRCWGTQGGQSDREAAQVSHPFAQPHQQFNETITVAPGAQTVVAANPNGGRFYVTGLSYYTDDATFRTVNVAETSAFDTADLRRIGVGGVAGGAIDETYSYPLRSRRGFELELVAPAGIAGVHIFNVTGYYD